MATVNSTTPRLEPRCPPVLDTIEIVSCLNSLANFLSSKSDNFFKSDGKLTVSNIFVSGIFPPFNNRRDIFSLLLFSIV